MHCSFIENRKNKTKHLLVSLCALTGKELSCVASGRVQEERGITNSGLNMQKI
jgi:hypothetical protein